MARKKILLERMKNEIEVMTALSKSVRTMRSSIDIGTLRELLIKHIDIVEECLNTALKTIQMYLKGAIKEAKELAKQVDAIVKVSDVAEDVADQLDLVILKSMV